MYQKYSEEVEIIDPIFKEVPIYKLIQTEIRMKYGKIMNDFYEYKKEMFILGSEVSEHISSINGYSYSLVEENNGLYFIKRKTDLTDLIRQYNNIIVTFLANETYLEELFSIVNIGERIDGSAHLIVHNKNETIDSDLKNMILLILIFPFIHEGLKETSYLIEELFDNSLKIIEKYLIIFYILREYMEEEESVVSDLYSFPILVDKSSPLAGKTIRDCGLRRDYDCMILGLQRNMLPIPTPDVHTIIAAGDSIWVLGTQKMADKLIEAEIVSRKAAKD
jgi:K+/H+ antiporter YhaU regulatory subunit KhtT